MGTRTHDPCVLYIGTGVGLLVARLRDGRLDVVDHGIDGNAVRDIAVRPDDPADAFVGCGLRGWGLYHTTDAGNRVEQIGFEDQWVWGVTRHPTNPETIYVGTEPPMLYRSTDNGSTFEPFEQLDELPSRSRWTFFHEPFFEGHVHGIALHPDRPERIFAGVEHGALLYSHDDGETWNETLVGSDVHRIAIDPSNPDHVLAATGSGLYQSFDAGTEWERTGDLRNTYLHAIVFDRDTPDRMYVYADRDHEPVLTSTDGGESWRAAGDGLPSAKPADTLRCHPTEPETLVYAGDTAERESYLFVSTDAAETWVQIEGALPKVWRVEVAPDSG